MPKAARPTRPSRPGVGPGIAVLKDSVPRANPTFWLPKPRAELRYRHCDSYGRIDVAVFSSSFAGISYPITARLLSSASSRLATRRRMPRADQGRVTERLDRLLVQD